MEYIPTFEQFIYEKYENIKESNLSREFLKFKPGDVVVITKSIKPTDFDFRKSARTWWGEKVASSLNIVTRGDKYNKNRMYKPGDVLWIFTKPSTIDSKGKAKITGYAGGFEGSLSDNFERHGTTAFEVTYEYDYASTQIIILALIEGYAEVVKYNKLPKDVRIKQEAKIKIDRILEEIINNSVIYDDMEITERGWNKNGYIFKGYNKDTGDKMPDKLVKPNEIVSGKFISTKTNKEITGDPFIKS